MATLLENLITARENFAAQLATESANPKPSYGVDPSVKWEVFRENLNKQIADLTKLINQLDGVDEIVSSAIG